MATVRNLGLIELALPSGHVIPRKGEIALTNELIRSPDLWTVLQGAVLAKQIEVEFDPDPEEPQPVKKGKTNG